MEIFQIQFKSKRLNGRMFVVTEGKTEEVLLDLSNKDSRMDIATDNLAKVSANEMMTLNSDAVVLSPSGY